MLCVLSFVLTCVLVLYCIVCVVIDVCFTTINSCLEVLMFVMFYVCSRLWGLMCVVCCCVFVLVVFIIVVFGCYCWCFDVLDMFCGMPPFCCLLLVFV